MALNTAQKMTTASHRVTSAGLARRECLNPGDGLSDTSDKIFGARRRGHGLRIAGDMRISTKRTAIMQRLLLVDDDSATRGLLHSALAMEGYEVRDADCGDEALRMLDRERPDIVLTDLIMPGVDGVDLCKAIRANAELDDAVIIALTGGDYPEALSGLCDVFLRKPVNIERLIDTLEQLEASKFLNETPVSHDLRW